MVFSSVLPRNSDGGELVLYRHLSTLVDWEVVVLCPEVSTCDLEFRHIDLSINSFWDRLRKTRFRKIAESYINLTGRFQRAAVLELIRDESPDIILTVAHGEFFWPAITCSRKLDIPLISIFHDWYPDMIEVFPWCRSIIQKRFMDLALYSAVPLCVSPGMIENLGSPPTAELLYPIPSSCEHIGGGRKGQSSTGKIIGYSGNLQNKYGVNLRNLMRHLRLTDVSFMLRFTGKQPGWLSDNDFEYQDAYLGFLDRGQLVDFLGSCSVLLVVMSFDINDKRRMETSFPSKFVEYISYGKPVVIWAPRYASAVKSAEGHHGVTIVHSENIDVLIAAIEKICVIKNGSEDLGDYQFQELQEIFNPVKLQKIFVDSLESSIP
ncbi:MAG: glycosyltransferase [Halioglobus sp.]